LLCAVARTWLGTSYHHHARVKGVGVDCGQFVAAVFHEAGFIEDVNTGPYSHDWMCHRDEERYKTLVERYAVKVDRAPMDGDIILFRFGRTLSHGAIVVGWPLVIHSKVRQGVIISSIEQEEDMRRRFAGIWTLREWT
jgi:NlpC/P60 family putative phage cell wall peptidase